ncbi:MAG: hypothetical protein WBG86_11145 [Polyangiales bacterium]
MRRLVLTSACAVSDMGFGVAGAKLHESDPVAFDGQVPRKHLVVGVYGP